MLKLPTTVTTAMLEQRVARSVPQGKAAVFDVCKSFRLLFSATGSAALLGFLPFP